jgi:hypothetical protein
MKSKHKSFGRADEGLVTCRVYEDGDVVVCHGERGNVENMADVSGHGPLLNMSDRLDLPFEYEQAVIDFVNDNTEVFEDAPAS